MTKTVLASFLAAAAALSATSSAGAATSIKICSIDDRSGAAAETGVQSYQALQLAVDEANAAGGIDGQKIEIIAYDGKTDPQLTASFATRCAEDDKGLVIIGGNPTAPASAMIPVATQFKIPLFLMSAAADNLTDPPAPFHFRFGPANRQDSAAFAELLEKQGFKRVALLNGSFPSLVDGGRATLAELERRKIPVVVHQVYDMNATDLSPQITNVLAAKPDVIVVFPYPADGARVMRTLRQLANQAPVIVARAALLETMRKLAGDASDGILIPNTVDPDRPDVKAFFDKYNGRFGVHQPSLYPVLGYDATRFAIKLIGQPEVLAELRKGNIEGARALFRDAAERLGKFEGLQGAAGSSYQFAKDQHHGPADSNWFIFIEVADKGTKLIKPDLAKFKAK